MFSIKPYENAIARVGASYFSSKTELRDAKIRIHAKARDIFQKIQNRIVKKWGPNGLSASIGAPGEVPIEKAQEFRDDKKFWQPFFDLYQEHPYAPARAYIAPGTDGIDTSGRWDSFVRNNFYTETVDDLPFMTLDSSAGLPSKLGIAINDTWMAAQLGEALSKFKVELDDWATKYNNISAGLEKEDPYKAVVVDTVPSAEKISQAEKDLGLGGLSTTVPGIADSIGNMLDKVILIAGIGLGIYITIQVLPLIVSAVKAKSIPVPTPDIPHGTTPALSP